MSPSIPQKYCSGCEQYKDSTSEFFPRNKNSRDGLHWRCKMCQKAYNKNHPDIIKKANDNHKKNNPDYQATAQRKFRKRYPEKIKEYKKKYAEENPDKVHAIQKRGYQKYKDIRKAKQRKYTLNNKEIVNAKDRIRNKKRYLMNPSEFVARGAKRRALITKAEGSHTALQIMQLYEEQEHRCAYCGITIFWNVSHDIHADHIQPLSRGGSNDIDNIALTCSSCNLSKHNKTLVEWMNSRGW